MEPTQLDKPGPSSHVFFDLFLFLAIWDVEDIWLEHAANMSTPESGVRVIHRWNALLTWSNLIVQQLLWHVNFCLYLTNRHPLSYRWDSLVGWCILCHVSCWIKMMEAFRSKSANVLLPDLQAGGFSAHGQPVDQLHHILRARLDLVDSNDVDCPADLRDRARI